MAGTLKDISKITGFSISTVSRALKNDPRISDKTKREILRVARELGYKTSIEIGNDKIIMLLVANPHESMESDEFFSKVQKGILENATKENFHYLVQTVSSIEEFDNTLVPLNLVDGIIAGGIPMPESMKNFLLKIELPVVLIGKYDGLESFPSVNNDNIRGGYLAGVEILKTYYEKVCVITGPRSISTFSDRVEGFLKSFKERGKSTDDIKIIELEEFDEKAGKKAVLEHEKFLRSYRTALFCTTDWLAKGALEELNVLKFKVPKEVGLLGFGGLSFCKHITPKISTVSLNPYLLGKIAFLMLRELLDGNAEAKGVVFVEPTVINGETLIRGDLC